MPPITSWEKADSALAKMKIAALAIRKAEQQRDQRVAACLRKAGAELQGPVLLLRTLKTELQLFYDAHHAEPHEDLLFGELGYEKLPPCVQFDGQPEEKLSTERSTAILAALPPKYVTNKPNFDRRKILAADANQLATLAPLGITVARDRQRFYARPSGQ